MTERQAKKHIGRKADKAADARRREGPKGAILPPCGPLQWAGLPDYAAAGFFSIDADGTIRDTNASGAALLGGERKAILGKRLAIFVADPSQAAFAGFLASVQGPASRATCEVRLAETRGDAHHLRIDGIGIGPAEARDRQCLLVATDVTDLRRTESQLRASEERFRALASDAPIGLFLADPSGKYEYVNPRWCEMSGLAFDEALGDGWANGVHPDDRKPVVANWHKVISSGGEWELEHRFQTPLGRITWSFTHTAPLIGDDGQACGYIGTCIDITSNKLAERALRDSEARYRALFEEAPVAYQALDADGHILDVNDPWLTMLGYTRDQVIGKPFDDFLQADSTAPFWGHFTRLKDAQSVPEALFGMTRSDGEHIIVSADTRVGHDARGRFKQAHCILHNVTEKERLQAELRRLATAIAQAGECIIITDAGGRIQYVNPAFGHVTGYSDDEAIGKTPRILKSGEHDPTFYRRMWDMISRGETWRGRVVNRRKDGSHYTADSTISPVFDGEGNLTHYVAVTRDVTREIQLERRYRQAQKLEAIGHLAGGVAHDFNNLLQVIDSCTKNAIAALPADSAAAHDLRDAVAACDQAATLVRKLRAFSKRQVMRPAHLDMNEVLAQSTETLREVIGDQIRLDFRPGASPLWILADRGMMEQVLVNLAINARDAMPTGGTLVIETRLVSVGTEDPRSHPCGKAGTYACLSITDTGRGMDEDALARVFEPYQGPESNAGGSGLCLSAVHGIIEQHGGTIHAQSTPGQGTQFDVYFPEQVAGPREPEEDTRGAVTGGTETILLAEDHDVVRRLSQQVLERAGYTVLAARDGAEAVTLFRQNADRVNLLLLDVVMPKLQGPQVYEAIRAVRPNVPALFQSGQHETAIHTDFILGTGVSLIQKPYDQAALLRKVREMLDS